MTDARFPFLGETRDGATIAVFVQPKAGKDELAGVHQGELKIRLTAPPVEGQANKACVKFLAKLLGAAKSDLEIVQGHKSRHKTVRVAGRSAGEVAAALSGAGLQV